MKIRWRYKCGGDWKNGELEDIMKIPLWDSDTIEIRLPCEHEVCRIADGMRQCIKCEDILEILSYRD